MVLNFIKEILKLVLSIYVSLVILPTNQIFAAWVGPTEVITGTWGPGEAQFGITYQETFDFIPIFTITTDQKIVVRDGTNSRLKIYTNIGSLNSIVPYRAGRHYTELTLADSYGFSGDFIGYGKGGINYFYRPDQKVYIHFSPTGELLKTTTKRPLELGWVKSSLRQTDGSYLSIVEYDDVTYSVTAPTKLGYFTRDLSGYLYVTVRVGPSRNKHSRVYKYNKCGRVVGTLDFPADNIVKAPDTIPPAPTPELTIVAEYGQPVIAPNGDVYTWKRTSDTYSILKWTWQDDPNPPADTPDAPINLTISSSPTSINLSWKASLQDPGCVTGYEIGRSTVSDGTYSAIGTVPSGVFSYSDTSAEAGTTYYYKVRAVGGDGYSEYSNVVNGQR